MKLGDYILSDDDIKDCQKRVEWLKNIIWIIENKPNQEMLTDDSILDMDGQTIQTFQSIKIKISQR